MGTCAICAGALGAKQRRYCSESCRNRRQRAPRKHEHWRYGQERQCEVCGQPYRYTYSKQRTCGRACGAVLNNKRLSSPVIYGNCPACSMVFIRHGHRNTCSEPCSAEMKRRLDRAYNATRIRPERSCPCGADLPSRHRHRCDGCLLAAKRRRRQVERRRARAARVGAKRERYTLAEIAARDRYRCGLCRCKVQMDRVVPHPGAPTIDHLIPLDCGGEDTRANVQLACFHCNSVKGNRGGGEQLALLG